MKFIYLLLILCIVLQNMFVLAKHTPLKAKPLKQPVKPLKAKHLKQPVKPLKQPVKPLKAKPLKQPAKHLKQPAKPLKAKPLGTTETCDGTTITEANAAVTGGTATGGTDGAPGATEAGASTIIFTCDHISLNEETAAITTYTCGALGTFTENSPPVACPPTVNPTNLASCTQGCVSGLDTTDCATVSLELDTDGCASSCTENTKDYIRWLGGCEATTTEATTTEATDADAADTKRLGTTAIVLIGIGGLVAVFAVVMVLKRAGKKSKDKNKYNILESEEESDASSLFSTTTLNF